MLVLIPIWNTLSLELKYPSLNHFVYLLSRLFKSKLSLIKLSGKHNAKELSYVHWPAEIL